MGEGAKRTRATGGFTGAMVPSPPMSPQITSRSGRVWTARAAAVLVLSLGLLLTSCGGGKKAQSTETPESTTSTTQAPAASKYSTSYATAKKPTLTVVTTPPAGVTTTTAAGGNTTTTARSNVPAIPRSGLNSAGVKKTNDGFEFTNPTYYKNPLVVQVVANQGDWLQVAVLARPNHQTGWVKASDVELGITDYRAELDLSTYTLHVYKAADLFLETKVAIGKDSTPTPLGTFFLTEVIKNSSDGGIYGAYIMPTSGYSEVLDSFDGGLPQIAMHGTNQPELLGTKASNGCIRMSNEAITKLATNVPPGTPLEIFATTPPSWSTPAT